MRKLLFYILLCLPLLNLRAEYVIVGYGNAQSANATITFPAGTLTYTGITTLPNTFTVAKGRSVLFTAGNLQYLASNGSGGGNTWRIAEHQYDMIGRAPGNTTYNNSSRETQTDWIDMFPYGGSGWDDSGVTYYQPWNYGHSADGFLQDQNLTGDYVEADWAWHNTIYNPSADENIPNHTLRVLTDAEWTYLLTTRLNASYLYAQAQIDIDDDPETTNYVNGLIILPDIYSSTYSTLKIHGSTSWIYTHTSYSDNTFSIAQWDAFEETTGAVFLPAAGTFAYYDNRADKEVAHNPNERGTYWSTTFNSLRGRKARYMGFSASAIHYGTSSADGFDGTRRVDDRLAIRAVVEYKQPTFTCTNCKDVTLDAPESPSATVWNITVNPGVGWRVFDEDVIWGDDATIHELIRSFNRTNPARDTTLRVTFQRKKAIYASTDVLLPEYKTDALSRGTVALNSDDPAVWPKTVTATPASGYVFVRWDDGIVTNPRTISTLEDAATKGYYTAHFAPAATSGDFVVDSHLFGWTKDSVYISTDANDLKDVAAAIEVYFTSAPGGSVTTGSAIKGSKADFDKGIYTIPTGNLYGRAGYSIDVVYLDKCGNVITHTRGLTVPKIIKESANASTLGLTADSAVIVLPGATLTINTNTTIASLTVQAGAKVVVNSGVTLTTGSLTVSADGIADENGLYSQLLINGYIKNSADADADVPLFLDYTMDYHKYYPLMLPYDVTIDDITYSDGSTATLDWDYEIKRYDGASRASGAKGWLNIIDDDPTTISASQGYDIFAVPQEWNSQLRTKAILRFPMSATLKNGETAKALPVSQHEAVSPNAANWNLIGNPYLSSFHELDEDADAIALIAETDDEKTGEKVRYITIPEDGFRNYNQVLVEDADISPFNVFFIQAAGDADLTIAVGDRHLKAPARQIAATSGLPKELAAGIIFTQGSRTDKTGILLGNAFTEGYDYNADLAKLFGTSDRLNVYSIANNTQLAYCALPYATNASGQVSPSTLSIGYRNASTENEAIFTFDSKRYKTNALEALYLTDNYTGETVDLLLDDYTFTPLKVQDDERFTLSAQPRRVQDVTTGLDTTTSTTTNASGVYDLLGRKICNSADYFKRIKGSIPAGVYIIIENGQQTKEIIR